MHVPNITRYFGPHKEYNIKRERESIEPRTYVPCVTAVRTVHDLYNDNHLWRSLWNVPVLLHTH